MLVKVKFFATFRELFKGKEVEVELASAPNVQRLLNYLCQSPKCRREILDRYGKPRPDVMILKNGKQIQSLDGVQTELEAGDTIAMFPPLGGG